MQAVANKKWTPEGQVETRYRKARKEWDDRMGGAVIQARNWRLATLLALGLVLVSLAGTIYMHLLATQSAPTASSSGPASGPARPKSVPN